MARLPEQQGHHYRRQANPHYAGHSAGIHPEDTPTRSQYFVDDGDVEEDDKPPAPVRQHRDVQRLDRPIRAYAQPRMPTSTRRYDLDENGIPLYAQRTSRIDTQYHDTPYKQTAIKLQKPHRKMHWLFFVGAGLFLVIFGYIGLNNLGAWWQLHTDDVTFGTPRTYQTDAVVGHGDGATTPSHFICTNLHGRISVLEAPAGDYTKAIDYPIVTQLGNDSAPCTVKFADVNGDGKLDMVVTVGDSGNQSTFFLFNTGTKFASKP